MENIELCKGLGDNLELWERNNMNISERIIILEEENNNLRCKNVDQERELDNLYEIIGSKSIISDELLPHENILNQNYQIESLSSTTETSYQQIDNIIPIGYTGGEDHVIKEEKQEIIPPTNLNIQNINPPTLLGEEDNYITHTTHKSTSNFSNFLNLNPQNLFNNPAKYTTRKNNIPKK